MNEERIKREDKIIDEKEKQKIIEYSINMFKLVILKSKKLLSDREFDILKQKIVEI